MTLRPYYTRILLLLFISASASSCNDPDQPTVTDTTPFIETSPSVAPKESIVNEKTPVIKNKDTQIEHQITIKKPTTVTPKTALNLSIENIEDTLETGDIDNDFDPTIDLDSYHLAQILTTKQKDDAIKMSGKLFTDQEMIDSGEYIDSVDGVQLNIKGSFR